MLKIRIGVNMSAEYPFEFLHSEIVRALFELDKGGTEIEEKGRKSCPQEEEQQSSSDEEECGANETCMNGVVEAINTTTALKQFDKVNAFTKLEFMGYRTGYALVERLCKELPRMSTELDYMKFICKEFWTSVFRKQVDNLRTNHQV